MSKRKKEIRKRFRNLVFNRDKLVCQVCQNKFDENELDAHHITDRNEMPNGGYVPENGITVCEPCHELVEEWHRSGKAGVSPGLHPDDLYKKISSSHEEAVRASRRLVDE